MNSDCPSSTPSLSDPHRRRHSRTSAPRTAQEKLAAFVRGPLRFFGIFLLTSEWLKFLYCLVHVLNGEQYATVFDAMFNPGMMAISVVVDFLLAWGVTVILRRRHRHRKRRRSRSFAHSSTNMDGIQPILLRHRQQQQRQQQISVAARQPSRSNIIRPDPIFPTAHGKQPASGQGELVLVVDDEPSIRTVTETMLKKGGYQVLLANDGTEAIALYAQRQQDIAVVLTDIFMPHFDGIALAQALRQINKQVKVIASTGQPQHERVGDLQPSNVQGFLPKPYTSNELIGTLQKVLSLPSNFAAGSLMA